MLYRKNLGIQKRAKYAYIDAMMNNKIQLFTKFTKLGNANVVELFWAPEPTI